MSIEEKPRIDAMQDEVLELHPLLRTLLPKLPDVTNVEYTHGPTEMGADFIVHKNNPTLGTIEYLGVIGKIGRIVQDFSELERQIEECALPRFILGGKEKIRLDEIWVIATGIITRGAQEKIHEKYSVRKISFLDSSRLAKLVDKYMPYFWTGLSIEAGEYLVKLKLRNEEEDRALSLLPILPSNLYIEQDLYSFPPIRYRLKALPHTAPKKVKIEELFDQSELVLIEGGMGSGKSKLLRHIVGVLCEPKHFEATKMIPVPVTYKVLQENYAGDIDKLIAAVVPEKVGKKHEDLTYLLIIDGVDEKNLPVDKHVEALRTLAISIKKHPKTKAIVTSRYLKGLEGDGELDDKIIRYQLAHLTISKIMQFIKVICTNLNITKRFIEDLKKSQLFKELPHSPIAAILLAKLINENTKELPSNMTELYAQYTEVSLGRWEIDKGLQTLKEYQAIEHILIQISRHVIQDELQIVTFDYLTEIVGKYLGSRNLEIEPSKLLDILMKRCEILMVDNDKKVIGFKHRTFAEFFFAKDMLRRGHAGVLAKAFTMYWMNCVFFYLGLLKDCPAELSQISNLDPKSEAEKWLKVINMSNYFLAAYASPYDVIVKGLAAVIQDAAELFNQIVERKIASPFACLSRMHLLYLMQYIIRESYSYQFFKSAFEEAALIVEEGPQSEILKAYALFFMNVAYIELGGIESFDFLLERHQSEKNN